ncbi:SLATT domain-containing protein [Cupriavidus basilensis]
MGCPSHLTARGFATRAQRFKENYTRLQGLASRLELAKCDPGTEALRVAVEEIQKEYQDILSGSENHSTTDDRCARFQASGLTSRKLTLWEYCCVASYTVGRYLFLAILYASPPLAMICLLLAKK